MRVTVLSLQKERHRPYNYPRACVVISAYDPASVEAPARVEAVANVRAHLALAFHEYDSRVRTELLGKGRRRRAFDRLHPPFSPEHARSILAFVSVWRPLVKEIVVCCSGGLYRSPSIACALVRLVQVRAVDSQRWGSEQYRTHITNTILSLARKEKPSFA